MTKRKASLALDDDEDNQHDHNPNDVTSRVGCSGGNTNRNNNDNNGNSSNLAENDNCKNNHQESISHNGSSGGMVVDGRSLKFQASEHQNDNSSSSSVETNNNLSKTNSGTSQQSKGKKERADNWSSAEIQVLHRGIETRKDIFYGPPNQATKKNRELAWEAITKEVNAVSSTPRTLSQVMKKFKNEKCRAKRKFMHADKDSHTNNLNVGNTGNSGNIVNNSNNDCTTTTTNDLTANLRAQPQTTITTTATTNHNVTANSHQQQQQLQQHQAHLMTTTATAPGGGGEAMTQPQTTSINVVKLAPQNVAKTMIDLPGHVQHTLQMPNDDMVLIVPPDTMDGLLGGVNIVSDGNGHHHFQKCSSNTLGGQHGHHNQHTIQTLNTNQGLMNGTMSNGMMARTIPAGSMCSLVYSTGNEVCAPEHHITTGPSSNASSHIAVNAQSLVHHRGSALDQGQQHHQLSHAPHATHQQLQQHQPHQQPHPQHQQHPHSQHQQHQHHHPQPHQQHPPNNHPQAHSHHQHLAQNHLTSSNTTATSINAVHGGVAVESQLKNLLFNLLLKDGHHPSVSSIINPNQDHTKQRNDMLAIIASSLTKIESHLSKISKVAGALFGTSTIIGENISNQMLAGQAQQLDNSGASVPGATNTTGDVSNDGLSISASDNNNNSFNISNSGTNRINE